MFSQLSAQSRGSWDKDIDSRPIKSVAATELGHVANDDKWRLGFLEDPESTRSVGGSSKVRGQTVLRFNRSCTGPACYRPTFSLLSRIVWGH